MSRFSKPLTLAHLNDATLGAFALVPSSETLDHLLRYLSTWSGSDKLFMIIQYAVKLIVPFLNMRARMQHRAGLRPTDTSSAAEGWKKLASVVSDARVLWRIWGLLPIVQWLISLERSPPPTRKLLTIERMQGWSMLAYYPLEHLYYLCSHSIIPSTFPSLASLFSSHAKPIVLNTDAMGIWSCRFWALYVVLQFAHLKEDRELLKIREKALNKAKGKANNGAAEKEDLQKRWDAFWNEFVVNVGYLPLTVHWSLEKGLFRNDVWVGVFGLLAAVASFRSGWKATALPTSSSSSSSSLDPAMELEKDAGPELPDPLADQTIEPAGFGEM
ncbi:hypothetical protein JAAARDRAFT_35956 [Jaapia argillacea MUCL 33604]|uniref:Uncharacterized protein n=1 Tax=Jaapia argillacea MUCL 33604 TaxID=933084 RepID=A0A067PU15_9AGAM|nr:hypothetical protein JAAARDRAFT_35956 [Jaapia argillacea MUCL 33604]